MGQARHAAPTHPKQGGAAPTDTVALPNASPPRPHHPWSLLAAHGPRGRWPPNRPSLAAPAPTSSRSLVPCFPNGQVAAQASVSLLLLLLFGYDETSAWMSTVTPDELRAWLAFDPSTSGSLLSTRCWLARCSPRCRWVETHLRRCRCAARALVGCRRQRRRALSAGAKGFGSHSASISTACCALFSLRLIQSTHLVCIAHSSR
jgi:hypothetical protein